MLLKQPHMWAHRASTCIVASYPALYLGPVLWGPPSHISHLLQSEEPYIIFSKFDTARSLEQDPASGKKRSACLRWSAKISSAMAMELLCFTASVALVLLSSTAGVSGKARADLRTAEIAKFSEVGHCVVGAHARTSSGREVTIRHLCAQVGLLRCTAAPLFVGNSVS